MPRIIAAAAASVVLALGVASPARAAPAPSELVPTGPAWESSQCLIDIPAAHAGQVTCGYLTVPERHGAPPPAEGQEARTVRLPVAIIASRALRPAPDPLVVASSVVPGRGGSIDSLPYLLDHAEWAGARDIVVVEQRGDLRSEPSVDCPELASAELVVEAQQRRAAQLRKCRDRLTADGVDLAAYSTSESVADLADLRTTLGYDQWNLYGVGYGSRLAMEAMRDAPTGLRSVILDGPLPPDADLYGDLPDGLLEAFGALDAACRADADCAARYPRLRGELIDLLDTAARTPPAVTVKDPTSRTPVRLRLTDRDLARGLLDALADSDAVRVLPFVIDEAAHGDATALAPLAQRAQDARDGLAEGLSLSIGCAEELPFTDAAGAAFDATHPILRHLDIAATAAADCAIWDVPAADPRANTTVVSDIPALIVVGGHDPASPLAVAQKAAAGLSHASVIDVPSAGAAPVQASGGGACPATIAAAFLTDPSVAPEAECIGAIPAPDFVTTGDIHPMGAFFGIESDLVRDRDPVQLGLAALLLLALVVTLGYAIVVALRPRLRARGVIPEGVVLPVTTAAILDVVFVVAMVQIAVRTEPLLLEYGMPAGAWPLLILPWVALASALLATGMLVRAWMRSDGALWHRVVLSAATAACLGTAVWLLSRGLLTF